ncbi:NAD(P)/FAD-dependent oxidoreductase [Saccharopolyspora shandongensis]|uniref:flavin monoamine oxidase family protein n=1 Tax=Saccharopolyspora shandongensis TaxID=418495 RepID=UPI00343B31B3
MLDQSGSLLDRRKLLKGLTLLGATGVAASFARPSAAAEAGTHADVLVLGAGIAGLGAARALAAAGRSAIVLEARDRIGGRMWTDRDAMGIPVERGAELIHGSTVSTWEFVRRGGIPTAPFAVELGRRDAASPWVDQQTWEFDAFPLRRPDLQPDRLPAPRPAESAEAYLKRVGVGPDNRPLSLLVLETDDEQFPKMAAESVIEPLREALTAPPTGRKPESPDAAFHIGGGYDQIVRMVAEGLDIRTGHVVTEVRRTSSGVEVATTRGGFSARKLVIALPAGVLQQETIAFDPGLAAEVRKRTGDVAYLPVFKGLLEFDRPVLPKQWDLAETYDQRPPSLWSASSLAPGYAGQVVVAWATGDQARALLAAPEPERMAAALDTVRVTVGDRSVEPVRTLTYDWDKDPFSMGAYPGFESGPDDIYAPLDDTVFWAGMVTSTVSSSLDTGRDAAAGALRTF